ncbi:MAG: hypothetical protein K2N90_03935 [Lachnospiraceae bacterium]|nr:hypothetical protein [Lachnospiraceae bacterium]
MKEKDICQKILLKTDLLGDHESVENFASETELTFSENDLERIPRLFYNGNYAYRDISLLYYFSRKDAEGATACCIKQMKKGDISWDDFKKKTDEI